MDFIHDSEFKNRPLMEHLSLGCEVIKTPVWDQVTIISIVVNT